MAHRGVPPENGDDAQYVGNDRVNEIEFVVQNPLNFEIGQTVRSPLKSMGDFKFRILAFPAGTVTSGGGKISIFVEVEDPDRGPLWQFTQVRYNITLRNFRNSERNVSKSDIFDFCNDYVDRGWHDLLEHSSCTTQSGMLWPDRSIRILASCFISHVDEVMRGPLLSQRMELQQMIEAERLERERLEGQRAELTVKLQALEQQQEASSRQLQATEEELGKLKYNLETSDLRHLDREHRRLAARRRGKGRTRAHVQAMVPAPLIRLAEAVIDDGPGDEPELRDCTATSGAASATAKETRLRLQQLQAKLRNLSATPSSFDLPFLLERNRLRAQHVESLREEIQARLKDFGCQVAGSDRESLAVAIDQLKHGLGRPDEGEGMLRRLRSHENAVKEARVCLLRSAKTPAEDVDMVNLATPAEGTMLTVSSASSSKSSGFKAELSSANARAEFQKAYEAWLAAESTEGAVAATESGAARLRRALKEAPFFAELEKEQEDLLGPLKEATDDFRLALVAENRLWDVLTGEHAEEPLNTFPSRLLLESAEKKQQALRSQVQFVQKSLQTCENLLEEMAGEEAALVQQEQGSPEAAARALKEARQQQKAAERRLQMLKLQIEEAHENGLEVVCTPATLGSPAGEVPLSQAKALVRKLKQGLGSAEERVRDELLTVARLSSFFPELFAELPSGLQPDLVELWRGYLNRSSFEEFTLLTRSRCAVYRVVEQGKVFAAKEHILTEGQQSLRTCLKEAAVLRRLRHPNVAEILGLFMIKQDCGVEGLYIMMPFYEHGSLLKWVQECHPDQLAIRRALHQVLHALAHLHSHNVIHGDVKPENILVGSDGRARLADFDIATEAASRTTTQYRQSRLTRLAFTTGFDAPELLQSGASPFSDMFSFGRTVEAVFKAMDPARRGDGSAEAGLIAALTSNDPATRLTADQALNHAFFEPLFRWRRDEVRRCAIRLEPCSLTDGLECSGSREKHFVSAAALEEYVKVESTVELRLRKQREGRIFCPFHKQGCDSAAYSDVDLARLVSSEAFRVYLASRVMLLEELKVRELEQQMQSQLEVELERLRKLDDQGRQILTARQHIENHILQLGCPRCQQAFVDFNGCWALTCTRCSCGFCGWCLQDCGHDAHTHVRQPCPQAEAVPDPIFPPGGFAAFEAHHTRRRAQQLQQFLANTSIEVRQGVLRELRVQLTGMIPEAELQELYAAAGLELP